MLAHPDVVAAAAGVVLGVGVCWPLFGGRPLLLLDWVAGPHQPFPSPAMLGVSGGLTTGVVGAAVMTLAIHVIGAAATWLVLFACFPVAAVGVGRLTGGWWGGRLAAAVLYCVNPWVFNRIYAGQLMLLAGYALLPFAISAALSATDPASRHGRLAVAGMAPVLWWAVLTGLSPHFLWIYGLVLVAVVVVRPWRRAHVAWLAEAAAVMAVLSLYVLLPHTATTLPTHVGTTSLDLYRTQSSDHYGLFVNVAGLYGFWRLGPGPTLPKSVITGWPLLFGALAVVIVVGYVATIRPRRPPAPPPSPASPLSPPTPLTPSPPLSPPLTDSEPDTRSPRRRQAWVLMVAGVAGYLLALGGQGPTGAIFRLLYDHVPFFAIMREPQKFLMLTAVGYAVGLGWGTAALARRLGTPAAPSAPPPPPPPPTPQPPTPRATPTPPTARSRHTVGWALAIGLVLPLAYTPTMFDGLAGQIGPSTIPPAYQQANRLMGDGAGQVLYLPWHLYEAQPFTEGRVVATVGPTFFDRPVLAGQDVQIGSVYTQSTSATGAYLTALYAQGSRQRAFGAAVAPLGVEYVVLAKTVDWRSYLWLTHQSDLSLVLDDHTLEVWRNRAYRGVGSRTGAIGTVRMVSPVAYRIPPGSPGTATIDADAQPGWVLDGQPGRPTRYGTVQFTVGRRGGVARFTPWALARLGYLISGGAFAVLALAVGVDRRRWRRGKLNELASDTSTRAATESG